jgi:hypothetical protein
MLADTGHLILVMVTVALTAPANAARRISPRDPDRQDASGSYIPRTGKRSTGPRQKADHQILCAAPGTASTDQEPTRT